MHERPELFSVSPLGREADHAMLFNIADDDVSKLREFGEVLLVGEVQRSMVGADEVPASRQSCAGHTCFGDFHARAGASQRKRYVNLLGRASFYRHPSKRESHFSRY